jgi:hypothetical protein
MTKQEQQIAHDKIVAQVTHILHDSGQFKDVNLHYATECIRDMIGELAHAQREADALRVRYVGHF